MNDTIIETQKTLHEVGKYANKINKIYPRTFTSSYEELIGVKHIVVTIDGKVYDIEKGFLSTGITQDGYLTVTINKKSYLVHRLVAMAFCVNHNKKTNKVVCHKNKVRTDNNACNLMWTNHTYIANRRDNFNKAKENIKRPIKAIDEDGVVTIFDNANMAMKELGVPRGNIYKVCKGKRLTAGGYKFSYATELDLLSL